MADKITVNLTRDDVDRLRTVLRQAMETATDNGEQRVAEIYEELYWRVSRPDREAA